MKIRGLQIFGVTATLHEWNEVTGMAGDELQLRRRFAALRRSPVTGVPEALATDHPDGPRLFVMGSLDAAPDWQYARAMYDAYNAQSGGVNFGGEPCPAFDDLPQGIKDNWLFTAAIAWHLFAPKES